MKLQNLSVKRLFGRVAMGLVLSMSGITIALFLVTKQTAVLLTGGPHEGNYYQPTVLSNVTPDMRIFYEESFGPVTSIIKAVDAQDAVRLCNDNQYGLSSSLLTNDLSKAMSLSLDMEAGMVHINNATVSDNSTVAFGGVKNSGVGREGGSYSIDEFTELKWITVQYTPAQLPF